MRHPVVPNRGLRQSDAFGAGHFGAPRGARTHKGLDLIAHPGDLVIAPFEAIVTHVGRAYADNDTLGSLHLHGTDGHHEVKMLYLMPQCHVAQLVVEGQVVGFAQDVASYHEHRAGHDGMTNHVHLEVRVDGELVDPLTLLEPVGGET